MRIGILTHYNVNNQGAQLQMYAMKHWLEDQGHEAVILTYEKNFDFDRKEEQKNSGSVTNYKYYIKNYLIDKGVRLTVFNTRKVLTHKRAFQQFATLPYDTDEIDAVIIGSDEVFSIDVGCNKMMYGHGLQVPAIAYAPAFGRSTEKLLKEYGVYNLIRDGLSDMYQLSARDTHTREMIRHLTGREVPLVCDPVFLYDGHGFRIPVKPIKEKYMIVYSYDRNMIDQKEIHAVKAYAKKYGLITVSLGTYHSWCDKNIVCNAEEWYSYFAGAECVLTDTFHGSVVAMKNHCRAAFFIRENINVFKMESLLEVAGLQAQRIKALTARQLEKTLAQPIDYAEVDRRIAEIVQFSEEYLRNALNGVRKRKNSDQARKDEQRKKENNISFASKYSCSGCGACLTVCPVNALQLVENHVGYYEVNLNEEKCIHCGKCTKVCSRYLQEHGFAESTDIRTRPLYAVQSPNADVVKKCSSGGFAHALSVWGLEQGRKVVGAVYDTTSHRVKHTVISEIEELRRLDGSKYLQSNTEVFTDIILSAKQNVAERYIVFGTPCQIAGLDQAAKLEMVRDSFLLVEIFCHGVPSYKLWDEERKTIEKKIGTGTYKDVQFRYKNIEWHSYCLRVEGKNGKLFMGSREKDLFYQVFFENILLNDSCMNCKLRKEGSFADLRIGDFWGTRFQKRTDGVSAVFTCTEKGEEVVQELFSAELLQNVDEQSSEESQGISPEEMLKAQNMTGYHQLQLHNEAISVLKDTGDISVAVSYYRKRMSKKQKMKRILLNASAVIPAGARTKLRKINSSIQLRK